jgi:hypothetical protein
MSEQQFSRQLSIAGVILGAAGDEGFAILLQRDGIDRIKVIHS